MIFWKAVGSIGRYVKGLDPVGCFFCILIGSMTVCVVSIAYKILTATGEVVKCYTEVDGTTLHERLFIRGKIKGLPDKNLGYASSNKEAIEFIYTNPSCPESKEYRP